MILNGLRDPDGNLVAGHSLGRGGEGAVFDLVGRPGMAMKLYFTLDPSREAKVSAFVNCRVASSCPSAAVPRSIVRDPGGAFVGFTMRKVQDARPLHDLYGSSSRRTHFPSANWRMIVRTAKNVACAVSEVHAAGLVIGDINHSSMLVSQRSLVTLIDADSWQMGTGHLCRVGVPEYTPPELQGRHLKGLLRTVAHDSFGLAVLLAQLIFLGRHPYAGVPLGQPLALPEAIARHQFAYSLVRDVRLRPPPGTLLLSDLPPALRVGFERAFGSMLGPRYTAAKWAGVLGEFERSLFDCPRDAMHCVPLGATSCPWCRIERVTGKHAFGVKRAASTPSFTAGADLEFDRMCISLNEIDSVNLTEIEPPLLKRTVRHSVNAAAFVLEGGGAVHATLLRSVKASTGGVSTDHFTRRHTAAELALVRALADWRRRIGADRAFLDANILRKSIAGEKRLAIEGELAKPCSTTLAAVDAALRTTRLADAVIPGLSERRRLILSAAGVLTAAHIVRSRLAAIVGLGSQCVSALLVWRDEVAALAAPLDAPERARAAHRRSMAATGMARQHSRQRLLKVHRDLRTALAAVMRSVAQSDITVDLARTEVLIATADLRFLKLPLPGQAVGNAPIRLPRALRTVRATKSSFRGRGSAKGTPSKRKVCPKCGASMVRRWGKIGAQRAFLGCSSYPVCIGKRTVGGRAI